MEYHSLMDKSMEKYGEINGEIWWKKENVVIEFVNQFLLPDKQNLDWRRGIPRS
jgi:hypothetical protein